MSIDYYKRIKKATKNKNEEEILSLLHHTPIVFDKIRDVLYDFNTSKDNKRIKFLLNVLAKEKQRKAHLEKLFIYAIKNNNNELIYWILDNIPFDTSYTNFFPFRAAIKSYNFEIAKFLYEEHNVDPFVLDSRPVVLAFEEFYNTDKQYIFDWIWNLKDVQHKLSQQNIKKYNLIKSRINFEVF